MEALLTGRLRLEQGCLVLDMGPTGDQLTVWPTYATWDKSTQTVGSTRDDITVSVDQRVRQGGGTIDLEWASYTLAPEELERLRACSERTGIGVIAVIQPFSADES